MSYFTDALSNFTTEVAYKDSIRHLYERGLNTDEIINQCSYPVTKEIVEKVISEYESKKSQPKSHFVEDYDQFGRKSLRKVSDTEGRS